MKKVTLFLVNLLFLSLLVAQTADETAKRDMEREVKTSGNYLWGEAVANTLDEALKASAAALITEANQEVAKRTDWTLSTTASAAAVKKNAEFIDLMRGNKYRAIAYIAKEKIEVLFDVKEEKGEKEKGEGSKKEVKVEEAEEAVFAEAKMMEEKGEEEKGERKSEIGDEVVKIEMRYEEEEVVEVEGLEDIVFTKATIYYYDNDDLLGQIVKAPSAREVNKLLADNKKNGKAVYGSMETMTHPENVYVVVYKKTGEIVAILDKGSVNSRRDLITGEMKNKDIYQGNQVVWFQIY